MVLHGRTCYCLIIGVFDTRINVEILQAMAPSHIRCLTFFISDSDSPHPQLARLIMLSIPLLYVGKRHFDKCM